MGLYWETQEHVHDLSATKQDPATVYLSQGQGQKNSSHQVIAVIPDASKGRDCKRVGGKHVQQGPTQRVQRKLTRLRQLRCRRHHNHFPMHPVSS